MGWFLEASKISIIMSLIAGILMGISFCQSIRDFYRKRNLWHLFPAISILVFLMILAIKYKEMLAPAGMLSVLIIMVWRNRYAGTQKI
jgi:asparagine N-glycosylation enzyme membrane subunit Stt3